MRSCLATGLLGLLVVAQGRADEAVLRDGKKVSGRLTLTESRWQFHLTGKNESLAVDPLQYVRLEAGSASPLHHSLPLSVELRGEQRLTGGLIEVSGKNVLLQPAWVERLTVPRAALSGLRHPPGYALVHAEDFRTEPKGWKLAGRPSRTESGLILHPSGQTAEFVLAEGVSEGRAAISFQATEGEPDGGRWQVEVDFLAEKRTRRITVHLAGAGKEYRVTATGLPGESIPVMRSPGQHRLVVQFSNNSLRVLIDDSVLWHSLKKGPGGPLVRWSMNSINLRSPTLPQPAREGKVKQVAFSAFSLHHAVDEPRRPAGDPAQDEVLLRDGDQLFGQFLRADRQEVVLEGQFGRRSLPWTSVRGVFPRPPARANPARDRVRLWLDNGFDSQPDILEGIVVSLDERRCLLRNADIGEMTIERGRLLRIAWPGVDQR